MIREPAAGQSPSIRVGLLESSSTPRELASRRAGSIVTTQAVRPNTFAAHRLMSGLGILTTQRVIFGDAVLIALFGEALLTDVGILSDLLRCSRVSTIAELSADLAPEEIQGTPSNCGSPEVFTLGVWLWELLTMPTCSRQGALCFRGLPRKSLRTRT